MEGCDVLIIILDMNETSNTLRSSPYFDSQLLSKMC